MTYGRKFRTGPYETAEIRIEDEFDKDRFSYMQAHDNLRLYVDAIVEKDQEQYQQQAASNPVRKR
jgi:hypothetical protein